MFIGSLSFNDSLATQSMSLNNKQCKTRHFLTDLNPVGLNYYLFMITLDKCNRNCNTFNDISDKIYVPVKTRDIILTRSNESKTLKNIYHINVNVNLTVKNINQIK